MIKCVISGYPFGPMPWFWIGGNDLANYTHWVWTRGTAVGPYENWNNPSIRHGDTDLKISAVHPRRFE